MGGGGVSYFVYMHIHIVRVGFLLLNLSLYAPMMGIEPKASCVLGKNGPLSHILSPPMISFMPRCPQHVLLTILTFNMGRHV